MQNPTDQTQGKTTNPMDNKQENKEKILRVMTGALSVLSYTPTESIVAREGDFNLMHSLCKNLKLFKNVKLVAVAGVPEPGLNRRPEEEPRTWGRT